MNFDPSRFTMTAEPEVQTEKLPVRGGGAARTDWVIPKSSFVAQEHDWVQRGYEISCTTCPHSHGTFLPVGKMLVGKKGDWKIVDEPVAR